MGQGAAGCGGVRGCGGLVGGGFLRGLSQFVMCSAGLCFLLGGRALHEFLGTDRLLAEFRGMAFAGLFLAGGWAIGPGSRDT